MQSKFKKTSHIYRINKNIDLGETTLEIPWNCILDFSGGGTITNGILKLNESLIIPNGCNVSRYISATITGSFSEGQFVYDTDLKKMKLWNGTAWVNLDGTEITEQEKI